MSFASISVMSRIVTHCRKHWGKYLFFSSVGTVGFYFAYNRYRDNMTMSELCREARLFHDRRHVTSEPLDKVFVLFNPAANRGKARKQFQRFATPLLYLSGADVTVIELDSEKHLREVVSYLPPNTSSVLVAGGSGTLLNVCTALLRRKDRLRDWGSVPIGVIPLGYSNGLWSRLSPSPYKSTANKIGRSILAILSGHSRPVDVMELTTEDGKKVYSLTGLSWGPLVEANIIANRFSLLGPMRGFFGFLRYAYRGELTRSVVIAGKGDEGERRVSALSIFPRNGVLELKTWENIDSKYTFAKQGASQTSYLTTEDFLDKSGNFSISYLPEIKLQPTGVVDSWYHIDGEEFEAFPIDIRILPKKLQFYAK